MKKIIFIITVIFYNSIYSQNYDVVYYMDYVFYLSNIDRGHKDLKIGFINKKGGIIEEAIFSDGVNNVNQIANVIKDSIPGYLDKKNKLKLFPEFFRAYWNGKIGYAIDKNKKYCLIDMNGKKITDYKYMQLQQKSEDYILVSENGKENYINTKGQKIFNDSIQITNKGLYFSTGVYKIKNKFGLININGKIITKPIYDEIYGDQNQKSWLVKKANKYGMINCDGKEFLSVIYDKINYVVGENQFIPVQIENKYGYVLNSKEVIPFIYDEALPFQNGIARVKKDNKYHYIDSNNKIICTFDHDGGWRGNDYFSDGLSLFKKNGKYGFINQTGKVVIEPTYDNANNFKEGISLVKKDGLYGFINTKGKIVIPIKYNYLTDIFEGRIMFGIK